MLWAVVWMAPAVVSAQAAGKAGRGYLGASIGAVVTASTASAPVPVAVYGESVRLDTRASWPAAATVELDGGVRLWRDFGLAVTVARSRRDGTSTVSGSIPHPYFFNQPRTLQADGLSLARTETAAHIGLLWRHRVSRRLTVAAVVGPSVVAVAQDVISGITWSETYPYTGVELSGTTSARRTSSATGGHAAGDLVIIVARQLGVTGGVRYSHAEVALEAAPGQRVEVDLGGVVVRGGVRWLF